MRCYCFAYKSNLLSFNISCDSLMIMIHVQNKYILAYDLMIMIHVQNKYIIAYDLLVHMIKSQCNATKRLADLLFHCY